MENKLKSFEDALKIVIESILKMGEGLLESVPNIIISIFFLFVTWVIYRIVINLLGNFFSRIKLRKSLSELFLKLTGIGIWVIGALIAMTIIFPGITPGKILTVLGLGSIAIGFAFKDIFENFLAGILILFREPFQIQDFIECEGIEGFVEDITIRDTHIRRVDGQRIVIPNAMLFKNPVYVRTDLDRRRITIICGIAYGESIEQARGIIRNAVKKLSTIDDDKPIEVFAREFNSSSIDFEVTWWTGSSQKDIRVSRDEVVEAVKKALDENGIEIPFPYRTLTFKERIKTLSEDEV